MIMTLEVAKMNNDKYWVERAKALSSPIWDKTKKLNKELKNVYQESFKELERDLSEWLTRYQTNHDLTGEDMKKIMTKSEATKFRYTVKGYMEKIEELGGDSHEALELVKELDIMGGRVKYQRYEELMTSIKYHSANLSITVENSTQLHLPEVFDEIYKRNIYEVHKATGIGSTFSFVDADRVKTILTTPWNGKNFSQRIWDNRTALVNNLRKIVVGGIMQGHDYKRMTKSLQQEMGTSYYKARRIVETETSFALSKAKESSYSELGIESYRYIATLDNRTSPTCQELDGKVFRNVDGIIGVNRAPMHPFCRSTDAPHFNSDEEHIKRVYRDPETGETKSGWYMSYPHWEDSYVTRKTESKLKDELIGLKNREGIEIKNISKHFINRAITRNVNEESVKKTFLDPENIRNGKSNVKGVTKEFLTSNLSIVINVDTGNLVTVHKRRTK